MAYKHGPYGERVGSKTRSASQVEENLVYFGVAPINLIRGYDDAGLVNVPVRLRNSGEAQSKIGYSENWDSFSLCEVVDYHFNNTKENAGPIYIINILDPDTHRKKAQTTKSVGFSNGKGTFNSDTIILDTLAIADKTEGVDYSLEYDFTAGAVTITSLIDTDPLKDDVDVTFYEVDTSMIKAADIIGQKSQSGTYSGIAAIALLYMRENAVPNILAAPGWSHIPAVYRALCSAAQKINGHWDGFVNADIPLTDNGTEIDTIAKAISWAEKNGYTSAISKVYWPQIRNGEKVYHLSTVGSHTMLCVDGSHQGVPSGIPFESPSNKEIMATDQYFGENSENQGFDQTDGNDLNARGITTAVWWDGAWKLWGPHTAAYKYNGSMDASAIFDTNMRMLMYVTNGFQKRNGTTIDSPMTPNDKDSVVRSEQEELDTLVGYGALIGNPEVLFLESDNPTSDMLNGDFVWDISATPTPPKKSATARVAYTDEGFNAFFGGES